MKLKRSIIGATLFAMLFLISFNAYSALTPGETYTVIMSKVNSNGTVTGLSSTSAVADSDGKITFGFSSVPTSPNTFFLVLTVKDGSGTVVRRSFVPAPPEGGTGQLGVNDLSTTQTDMILQALAAAGTDDPIVVAYGLILTRTPDLDSSDIANIAVLGHLAIQNGFETFLAANGVSASQLATFKQKLIYNQPNKDLSNFAVLFKSAVDNPAQSADDMAKAAGLIADIFIDAGIAAGIDLSLIQAAHDAAGDVVQNDPDASDAFNAISGGTGSVIDAAMSNFFMRIAAVKVKTSYTNALTILNASGIQVDRFNAAVQTMTATMENLDKEYAQYYSNPELMTQEIKDQMNTDYSNAFNTFQNDIASLDEEISQMKTNVANAIRTLHPEMSADDIKNNMLPQEFGTYWDMNHNQINWPIPQVVAVNWVASIVIAGGGLSYDRAAVAAALPIPSNMNWLNNPHFPDSGSGSRNDYVGQGIPGFFASLLGMQEDMNIAENTRWNAWQEWHQTHPGEELPRDQQKAAKLAYVNNVVLIISSLSGTTDVSTPISGTQKEALGKMMEHPELN
jgi:hypothetical protein